MDILELVKKLIKTLGVYKLLEKWIVSTSLGANIYLFVMQGRAAQKRILLRLEKKSSALVLLVARDGKIIKISMRHFAYLQDVVDNFSYYFDAVQPEALDGQMVVDYSMPRQHVLMPSGIPFYFSSFAEPLDTTDIYLQKGEIKAGDIVLDMGAYCGSTVWGFSRAVGEDGMVYAFEPDPVNYEVLCKNIEYHRLSNVVAINKGLWSTSGDLMFQSEGNMGSGISEVQGRAANLFQVSVISLSDFCAEYKVTRIDYIKMDIEGAEIEVLKTSGTILKKYRPRLILEPHVINARLVTDDVCDILSGYGYETEVLEQAGLPLPLIYATLAGE